METARFSLRIQHASQATTRGTHKNYYESRHKLFYRQFGQQNCIQARLFDRTVINFDNFAKLSTSSRQDGRRRRVHGGEQAS
uniref:9.6 kDa protein n=1 Tax=Autographa californica nuclear polyhedrosis virus TaxID=46015 RepID=Q64800_NPVAC|nr:9.6 kDa protein [Autographa californica nucleopolyhedrovirus]